jgi:hypothetical protein
MTAHVVSPADLLNQARVVVCLDRRLRVPAQASIPRSSVHAARFVPASRSLTRRLRNTTTLPLRPPYNPHSVKRRSHAVQFNEVYPHGPATGHVSASRPCGSSLLC